MASLQVLNNHIKQMLDNVTSTFLTGGLVKMLVKLLSELVGMQGLIA